jgi:hypothetical protein
VRRKITPTVREIRGYGQFARRLLRAVCRIRNVD